MIWLLDKEMQFLIVVIQRHLVDQEYTELFFLDTTTVGLLFVSFMWVARPCGIWL